MRKRLPITQRGAAVTGGTIALLIGGLLTADGWLLLLSLCGTIILTTARLLGHLSLRQLTTTIHLPSQITAGTPCELEITLNNNRRILDAFHTTVQLTLPGKTKIETIAPWTPAGSISHIRQQVTLPRRGYADTHPVTLSTTFPLGLFHPKKITEARQALTITPRPITPLELNSNGSLHDTIPRNGITSGQNFGEPRGIRPWQAGDSARSIHWPASARSLARGHSLRVREYDPPGFHPNHCHIVFHSYATGREMLREDRFERALSLLAGSIIELQNRAIPCVLNADFLNWQPLACSSRIQVIETLNHLAHAHRNRSTEAHDLETTLHTIPPDHTLMIISDMPPDSWQHLLTKHPRTLFIDIRQISYRHKSLQTAV